MIWRALLHLVAIPLAITVAIGVYAVRHHAFPFEYLVGIIALLLMLQAAALVGVIDSYYE